MQSSTLVLLLLIGVYLGSAQMTFSDGWGKRAAKPFEAAEEDKGTENSMLDACHHSYSQSLLLYESYQQCQSRAAQIFQTKQHN
ncbi:hypothetical protein M3Y99_00163400 [Aphelenchoides fujianensis]|nr:hypothetical protein M3Y99_00163400 [Aphelenchoides fujianensis]